MAIERMTPIRQIDTSGRIRTAMGDLDALAKSIKDEGLRHAILLGPNKRLISGLRRLQAHELMGRDTTPTITVHTLAEAVAVLGIEDDTEQLKMTISERIRLGMMLTEVARPETAQRRRQGALRIKEVIRGEREPSARIASRNSQTIANAVGFGRTVFAQGRLIVRASRGELEGLTPESQALAAMAVERMDRASVITPAYEWLKAAIAAQATGSPVPVMPAILFDKATLRRNPSPAEANRQRRLFDKAAASLTGIAHALGSIDAIAQEITRDEAARWVDSLSPARRAIERAINELRGV